MVPNHLLCKKYKVTKWTNEEDAIIMEHAANKESSIDVVVKASEEKKLPNAESRARSAVSKRFLRSKEKLKKQSDIELKEKLKAELDSLKISLEEETMKLGIAENINRQQPNKLKKEMEIEVARLYDDLNCVEAPYDEFRKRLEVLSVRNYAYLMKMILFLIPMVPNHLLCKKYKVTKWTNEEDAIIMEHAANKESSIDVVVKASEEKKLPNAELRTRSAVSKRFLRSKEKLKKQIDIELKEKLKIELDSLKILLKDETMKLGIAENINGQQPNKLEKGPYQN
ncbi:hypothetical protein TSUD_48850 [Trifolium subterraneum]|uniref:Uncharacterized protein n=1 Tax=Trifolium subterraneum TaxID=3900 RepID=A0A2Z6N541_TRISU|nr:hypothetical protein TSUD_48850 [Trifolium subterraneum]